MSPSFPVLLALLLALLGPVMVTAATESAESIEERVMLVLGDSLSAAHNIPVEAGWAHLLSTFMEERGWRLVNASISGETTSGGLRRLPGLLEEHRPAAVIIELGANDGLRGTPLAVIEQQLASLVEQVQGAGARAIVTGMYLPPNYGKRYNERFHAIFKRVAEQSGAVFIPFLLEGVATRPELMQRDGLHPTAEAQPLIRDTVSAVLERQLERW